MFVFCLALFSFVFVLLFLLFLFLFYLVKEHNIERKRTIQPILYCSRSIRMKVFCTLAIIHDKVIYQKQKHRDKLKKGIGKYIYIYISLLSYFLSNCFYLIPRLNQLKFLKYGSKKFYMVEPRKVKCFSVTYFSSEVYRIICSVNLVHVLVNLHHHLRDSSYLVPFVTTQFFPFIFKLLLL